MKQNNSTPESGNAFFIVMIGVILFAALMFTFSRGARQGGGNLSEKQAGIFASDILNYTQRVERGLARVYSKGFSENDISFENNISAANYANANCGAGLNRCKVFLPAGGGATYKPLESSWSLSQTDWVFTGANGVFGLGQDCAASRCSELIMMIEDVPMSLCIAINEQVNLTSGGAAPPTDANVNPAIFTSTFAYAATDDIGDEDVTLNGVRTGCFLETGSGDYYFYHTLLER